MESDRFVDAAGLASLLGISTRTLARLVKTGEVPPPIEMGRLRRWNLSDFNDALRRQSRKETRR